MAIILNTLPGDPNANSYATLAEANAYHETVLEAEGELWLDAEPDVRNRALATATRLLDENFQWTGYPASLTQALGFPRSSAYTRHGRLLGIAEIPVELKRATAELARRLISDGMPDAASDTEGLKRLKAGPVELEFDGTSGTTPTIPPLVRLMVLPLIARTEGSISVPVIRT